MATRRGALILLGVFAAAIIAVEALLFAAQRYGVGMVMLAIFAAFWGYGMYTVMHNDRVVM